AGELVSTATDIFQVGAQLYRLIVGRPWITSQGTPESVGICDYQARPPAAPSRTLIARARDGDGRTTAAACGYSTPEALARRVRGDLDAIVMKCLSKRPSERYGTMDQLKRDLRAWMHDRPTSVLQATPWRRAGKWFRRHHRGAAVSAAGLAAVL